MGTWGTGIMGNDTSCEVYDYFKRMYLYIEGSNYKWSEKEIIDSLYTYYNDTIENLPSEKCNILFAIGKALWEIDEISETYKEIVFRLISQRIDYDAWQDLDATESDLRKRLKATEEFYKKISIRNPNPKRRIYKSKKISALLFGDCLSIKLDNNYYGIVITEDGRNRDDGTNDLTLVDIKKKEALTLDDFKNSSLLLNEELVNSLKGIISDTKAYPSVIFTFRYSKNKIEELLEEVTHIGNLNFSRAFCERNDERISDITHKENPIKLLEKSIRFLNEHQWNSSAYKLRYDCIKELNIKEITTLINSNSALKFDHYAIIPDKVRIKIENCLWHINIWICIIDLQIQEVEKTWMYFVGIIEQLTKREINNFRIVSQKNINDLDFKELNKVDFTKYYMKHVEA